MLVRRIKFERKKRHWSLEYVGTKIGITKQSLFAIENGENDPSYEVLCKLENLFQMNHRELFDSNLSERDISNQEQGGEPYV